MTVLDGDLGVVNGNADVTIVVLSTLEPMDSVAAGIIIEEEPVVQVITVVVVVSVRAAIVGVSVATMMALLDAFDEDVAFPLLGSFSLSLDTSCSAVFLPVVALVSWDCALRYSAIVKRISL